MLHFPRKRYKVIEEGKIGPNAKVQWLHATSSEPDGSGGSFTRNYYHVVLVGKGDEVVIEFPVSVRDGNYREVYEKAVADLS